MKIIRGIRACLLFMLLGASPGLGSAPATLDLVGYVPDVGQVKDVAIDAQAGVAYVASLQFGLAAVDITNPARPVVVSTANPAFYAERVAVDGPLAVAVSGNTGLTVVNVSTPRVQPLHPLGSLLGVFRGVALVGRAAYVLQTVTGNPAHVDLVIVDLGNPSAPNIIGRVTVGDSDFVGVRVVGSFAYVTAGSTGLRIVDVSSPTAPKIVATVDMPGLAQSVDVVNGVAYVAASTAMVVVDVHTPSRPVVVGSIAAAVTNVVADSNTVYALGGYQLQLFDVSVPAAPRLLSATSSYGAQGLDVLGHQLYLASPEVNTYPNPISKGGLYVIDVTSPQNPVVLTNVYNGFANSGVASDGQLAVATGGNWGLRVLNVSNPSVPVIVGQLAGTFGAVALTGSRAYVLETIPGNPPHVDLVVVDLGVPGQPAVIGRVTMNGGNALEVKVAVTLAYVAASYGGLQIVDLSVPSGLKIIGAVTTPYAAVTVDLGTTGYAYVGTSGGIYAVDVRSPTSPVIAGSIAASVMALATANQLIYALDGQRLKVIDVTLPSAPIQIATLSGVTAQDVTVTGSWLVLARPALWHTDTAGGLYLVDVSDPTQPTIIDQTIVPGTTRSVTARNNIIYAGDSASTLDVLMINPTGPVTTPTPTRTRTPTVTATPTATVAPFGVAGLIHYFSSPSVAVNGATVQLRYVIDGGGPIAAVDETDMTGGFAFAGIGANNWQVQPSKTGATNNPVDVNDAVAVLEASVNLRTLSPQQEVACDVSGNGGIDVDDAVLILEYVVNLISRFPVAQVCNSEWAFIPEAAVVPNQQITLPQITTTFCQPNGAITYRPLVGQANNQNFSGVLFGDCLGRWQPGTGAAAAMRVAPRATAEVRVGHTQRRFSRRLLVPLTIPDNIRGFSAQLHYDASQMAAIGVLPVGTSRRALVRANLREPGLVTVALASVQPLRHGQVLIVEFALKSNRTATTRVHIQRAAVSR